MKLNLSSINERIKSFLIGGLVSLPYEISLITLVLIFLKQERYVNIAYTIDINQDSYIFYSESKNSIEKIEINL
jgi:hypothetical protein